MVFDGWRKACEWGSDPDSPVPGIFGPKRLPMLDRWDYATNSNDSHWANNARQLLEGFPAHIGDERTQRSLRTRNGLHKIESRLAGTDGLPGNKFSLAQLEQITMNDRVFSAELWRDSVVALCRGQTGPSFPEACDVLARWDLTDNLDSPGSVLWRRFMENVTPAPQPDADFFTVPLDPKDPIGTPRGLNSGNPKVAQALIKAIADLRDSGMPLDAKLRDYQIEERSGQRIPIHGGPAATGQYNLIYITRSGWVPGKGWSNVLHASSFVAWVQFTDHGPVARSIMTSSQSDNPESEYHADQTLLFSRKESKPVLFDEAAIRADPGAKTVKICRTAAGAACR
jgi:acyl-homoserine-lactone acylase